MQEKQKVYGIVYIIINKVTSKVYIGQKKIYTSIEKDFSNYWGSGILICRSIKKYGKQWFKKEIIGYCYSKEELNCAEKECIKFYNCLNPYGYNISEGGQTGCNFLNNPNKEEIRKKLSIAGKNRTLTDKHKINIGIANKGKYIDKYGKDRAKEIILKRKNTLGNYHHTEETKIKISKSCIGKNKGRKHTEEAKAKISNANIGNKKRLNKKHTIETKNKISASRKGYPAWNKNTKCAQKAWNKGLNKYNDERVKNNVMKTGRTLKEKYKNGEIKIWNKGLKMKNDVKIKISNKLIGNIPCNKGKSMLEVFIAKYGKELGLIKFNEYKEKCSKAHKGKKLTNEHKLKIKMSNIGKHNKKNI